MVSRSRTVLDPGSRRDMGEQAAAPPSGIAFSPDEIEAGRKLFAREWRFLTAAGSIAALPIADDTEIAFAGRSNVGKSSLINALTGRRALARTSRTPGRTQELVFFSTSQALRLVDLPGYGYAAAPKPKVAAWTRLIHAYVTGRPNLARIYVLIDARHGLKPADAPLLRMLDDAAVSYQLVLTKCDELDAVRLARVLAQLQTATERRPAAFPAIAATSARSGYGIAELRASIARLVAAPEPASKPGVAAASPLSRRPAHR
jgi:GTP-binding protein